MLPVDDEIVDMMQTTAGSISRSTKHYAKSALHDAIGFSSKLATVRVVEPVSLAWQPQGHAMARMTNDCRDK